MGKGAYQVERTEWRKEGRGKEIFVQEKVLSLNPVLQYWELGGETGGRTGWSQMIKGLMHHAESFSFILKEAKGPGRILGSDHTPERAPVSRRL